MASIQERKQIGELKSLTREPGWAVVMILLEELVTKIDEEEINGANEFETLRMLHTNRGVVKGMKMIIEEVEKRANQ